MKLSLSLILTLGFLAGSSAFTTSTSSSQNTRTDTVLSAEKRPSSSSSSHNIQTRLSFLQKAASTAFLTTAATTLTQPPEPANALVKGNAPPPKKGPSEERKCVNVEECQEMAERLANKADEEARANMVPASVAPKGTKYRETVDAPSGGSGVVAKEGDQATIFYKVLKLGKRSYDGLSGEGTVVFSRGYGLEDDENKPGDKSFTFTIGDNQIIAALSDAIQGQAIGSVRRVAVTPQTGWEKATKECDGGPGGSGSGGELKTDYVVVPTATMVATEICFDKAKLPFPSTYAEQRRMAQRFDQSLIMEVELVGLK